MISRGYSSKSSNVSLTEKEDEVINGSSDCDSSREVAAIILEFPTANEKVVEWIRHVRSPQSMIQKPSPIQSQPNVR